MPSHLKKVDHITYACAKGQIEKWAWFHIEVEGGRLINRIDDVRPDDPSDSMKIWCIDYGEFGVALIEGIDRASTSQVTASFSLISLILWKLRTTHDLTVWKPI